jgi:type III restriction enzyme
MSGEAAAGRNFRFDSNQQYQLEAVAAVIDLFDGQPGDAAGLVTKLRRTVTAREGELPLDTAQEIGAIGNSLVLDEATILTNLQAVQDRNGLEVRDSLADGKLDFDIEMETGTGKTYVYLRTIFELARRYNFSKFIILVPSVAVREGVNTSIRLMREHFRALFPALQFDSLVYSGDRAEDVQAFATSTNVQIIVMTIDALRGDKNTRIVHQERDRLNGLRPIDCLRSTRPIIIMDEPQNMESALSQSAVGELDPAFTLRYSATHKQQRNLVFRLDPVDAHELGLVKQVVVAEVTQHGADAAPYVKLLEVKSKPKWSAKLELACRKADGSVERKTKAARPHEALSDLTGNVAYEGWRINEMRIADGNEPASIELSQHGILREGEAIGSDAGAIYREMIRETVREHLHREAMLRPRGIKVLSLFFVDRVTSFLGNGVCNEDANGDFARWFDEVFVEERTKDRRYADLLPEDPRDLRRAYFSQLKSKGRTTLVDSSGGSAKDDDAYELIMRDKERLLDGDEPVRFIFSHSALAEGWDNPNVFQICMLREAGTQAWRRQTLGRGLRLPVAKTENGFERVVDRAVAVLTVIANETYAAFAQGLQNEYRAAGVAMGQVRPSEFAKLLRLDSDETTTDAICGYKWSKDVFDYLEGAGFLKDGKATSKFLPDSEGFSLHLPEAFKPYEAEVIALVGRASIDKYVKPKSKRQARKLNKELYTTSEFERFWNAISQKTTYRVTVEREALLDACVTAIRNAPPIAPLRIEVTLARVTVSRGGAQGAETRSPRVAEMSAVYELPDLIGELQHATSLTRGTLVDIVVQSGRLAEFVANPNDFIAMTRSAIRGELAKIIVEGIEYEPIGGSIYELRELQADGLEEKERFLDQMYRVKHRQKTDFDWVVYDSDVERKFAELLDSREDVKLFMKLPARFKVPTPVGDYIPDWAIIKQVDGQDRIYMIRETKSTNEDNKLRWSELAKIRSARKHFAAIGVEDYARSIPDAWNL